MGIFGCFLCGEDTKHFCDRCGITLCTEHIVRKTVSHDLIHENDREIWKNYDGLDVRSELCRSCVDKIYDIMDKKDKEAVT